MVHIELITVLVALLRRELAKGPENRLADIFGQAKDAVVKDIAYVLLLPVTDNGKATLWLEEKQGQWHANRPMPIVARIHLESTTLRGEAEAFADALELFAWKLNKRDQKLAAPAEKEVEVGDDSGL